MEYQEIKSTKKIGLIAGYKPNRISLYILMLTTGRLDELMEVLYKDMRKARPCKKCYLKIKDERSKQCYIIIKLM